MRPVRRIGLVFATLLLLIAAVPAEGSTPLVRHPIPGIGFSIGVPKGWKSVDYRQIATTDVIDRLSQQNPQLASILQALRNPNSGVKLFSFDPSVTAGFATNMNVVVERVPAGTTAASYANAAIGQLGGLSIIVRPIRHRTVRLPAATAEELRYGLRLTVGTKHVVTSTTQDIVTHGSLAYVVTYTTLPAQLARRAPTFGASARSIRLS
jgi:hypothetical protein